MKRHLFAAIAFLAVFFGAWFGRIARPSGASPISTSMTTAGASAMLHPTVSAKKYMKKLRLATFRSIEKMVNPITGLPHDKIDASLLDIVPQLAFARACPHTEKSDGATIEATRCRDAECRHSGKWGLRITYSTPPANFASYNFDVHSFDASKAAYLEFWAKGERGGERFEIVLWSDRQGQFPGRPATAERTLSDRWERHRIPVLDFSSKTVDISKLSRLAFGFNDAMSRGGTIFIDQVSFVDGDGNPVDIGLDEPTSVTNIGLYMSSRVGAVNARIESYDSALSKLGNTLTSLERMEKWRGFPQTHNHVVSLKPDTGDRCISFVDTGYLVAGLILARQRFPQLASRVSTMLDAMDWNWFYDDSKGLPYGCRFPDGSASTWHYNFYGADSLLAHFIAIGSGKFPPATWNNLDRSKVAPQCAAKGFLAPGWQGGGVFMQFLPGIFIDEEGTPLHDSACAFVDDQICFSRQIGAPAWGGSATATPPLGCDYCGFGCVRNEIVVPHASILAIDCIKRRNLVENLVALEQLGARQSASDGGASYDFGFRASINWQNGEVATPYLVLDQSMAFLSLCNDLNANVVRKLFCQDPISRSARDRIPEFASRCVN